MSNRYYLHLLLLCFLATLVGCSVERAEQARDKAQASIEAPSHFSFVLNAGQWDARALYRLDHEAMRLWFASDATMIEIDGHILRHRFVGAGHYGVRGAGLQKGRWIFMQGADAALDVPGYDELRFTGIYPGIDGRYYRRNGALKYELEVAPAADPRLVRFRYDGADSISITADGKLRIQTSAGDLLEDAPYVYQRIDGVERSVPAAFSLNDGEIAFEIGSYDTRYPLTIDPALVYSSYLGGAGNDSGEGIALDTAGRIYVTGMTRSSNFPTTVGAFSRTLDPRNQSADVFVASFDPTGTVLLYGTYIGGSGIDEPAGIVARADGSVTVAGTTSSPNFPGVPLATPLQGATDGFVVTLDASGARLLWSTYLGGSADERIEGIALAPQGDVVVVGGTTSTNDFPFENGAYATSSRGQEDAFVTRLIGATGKRRYSTYLGGEQDDRATAVVVEKGGAVYLTGWTRSINFPVDSLTFAPAYRAGNAGRADGFVTRLQFDFTALDYSSYIGGSDNDYPAAIAIDSVGEGGFPAAYITGTTASATDFPDSVSSGPGTWFLTRLSLSPSVTTYSRLIAATGEGRSIQVSSRREVFLAGTAETSRATEVALVRVSANGRTLLHSQTVGGTRRDIPSRQSVLTPTGDLYLTGTTFSPDFPTRSGSWDRRLNDAGEVGPSDAFLLRYNFEDSPAIFAVARRSITPLACDTVRLDSFYIYNASRVDLEVSDLKFARSSPQLSVPTAPLEPIKPGDSLRVVVRFASATTTVVQDTLLVYSNDPRFNPLRIAITATRSAPGIVAEPAAVRYSRTLPCASPRDTTIEVVNSGLGSVRLVAPGFQGGSGAFTLLPTQSYPTTILQGQRKGVTIRFTPRGPGTFRDTLLLRTDECNAPLRIPLEGVVDSVGLRFSETELRIPPLAACATELDTFVTVINTGSVPLTGFRAPSSSPQFTLIDALPASIPVGDSARIRIRYTPTSGSVAGNLLVGAAPCSVSASIDLFASQRDRQSLDVNTALLDFGSLIACRGQQRDSTLHLTLINSGELPISLEPPSLAAPFELVDPLPAAVAPESNPQVSIRYRPIARGGDTVELEIPYIVDGCRDTARIVLRGFREEPLLEPERQILEFAPLGDCEARAVMPLVLFNRSSITSTVTGSRATAGVSIFRPTLPFEILPGESDTIWVRFEPRHPGASNEELTLLTEPCGDSIPLLIRGSKAGGVTTFDDLALVFPPRLSCAADVDSFAVVRFTGGAGNVRVRSVALSNGSGTIVAATGSGRILAPDDTLHIPVRFSPSAGSASRELQVVLEPCGDTLRLPVSTESITPALTIEGGAFGAVPSGGRSGGSVIVRNPLSIPVTIEGFGNLPLPFSLVDPVPDLPITLGPGDSLIFELEFAPLTPGSYSPTALITASSGCQFGVNVQLTGEGETGGGRLGLCISGDIRGGVGDTVTVSVRADSVLTFPVAGTVIYSIPYDPERLLLTEVRSDNALQVIDSGYPGGVLRIRQSGLAGIGSVPLVLRFMLLAGAESTTSVRLDSIGLEGAGGVTLAACSAVAAIEIVDDCLVGGLIRGKYANRLELAQPNPSSGIVEITWQQLESARSVLRIFDAGGRELMRPLDRWLPGGRYTVRLDLSEMAAGGYFYMIEAGEYREAKRGVLVR